MAISPKQKRSIFYDFLAQKTLDHKQKNGKKLFQNFYPFLRKQQLCKS